MRPAGREYALELEAADDVWIPIEPVLGAKGVVAELEARRDNHGARFDIDHFVLLAEIDGLGLAEVRTRLAGVGLGALAEVHAGLAVDDGHLGYGLLVGDVDRGTIDEPGVELVEDRSRLALGELGQVDRLGRTDDLAGPAGHAHRRMPVVGRADRPTVAPPAEVDRTGLHQLRADPRTQAAEDAIVVPFREPGLGDAEFGGHFLDLLGLRAASQEQLGHDAASADNLLRAGSDDQPFPGRIETRRPDLHAAPLLDLDQAEPTCAIAWQ